MLRELTSFSTQDGHVFSVQSADPKRLRLTVTAPDGSQISADLTREEFTDLVEDLDRLIVEAGRSL